MHIHMHLDLLFLDYYVYKPNIAFTRYADAKPK